MKYTVYSSEYPFTEKDTTVVFFGFNKGKAEAVVAYMRANRPGKAFWVEESQ